MPPKKRKFCNHCNETVSEITYRRHADLSLNRVRSESAYSSEEEDNSRIDGENVHQGADDLSAIHVDQECNTSAGTSIADLKEEDVHLIQGGTCCDSDSDQDCIYRARMQPDILKEVWDMAVDDVDADFGEGCLQEPSVDVFQRSRLQDHARQIVRWVLIFLCLWSSFCSLSENALDILLGFLRAVFYSMGMVFPVVASFAVLFPKSVHSLRKQLGIDQDKFVKYVVCPKCHQMYNFNDCYETVRGTKVTRKCPFVQFPNHRQHFRRTQCCEPLLKEVSLKSGETKLYPFKVYCYNSVIANLQYFLQRPGFAAKCEMWRSRDIPDVCVSNCVLALYQHLRRNLAFILCLFKILTTKVVYKSDSNSGL